MKNRACDITWNDFGNMLIFIALPIAVQNLLTTTASMIDTIMIGSQGELSVAAVGIPISYLYRRLDEFLFHCPSS